MEQNIIEHFFYLLQVRWMKKRRTKEIISPYLIAFHPKDISKKVLARFKKAVGRKI